ncbi:MAG: hypothetical protein IKP27_08890 [Paludibacteraceae bacterium]|nr:hypothetical protein [Paludibacteraceae bacterium]
MKYINIKLIKFLVLGFFVSQFFSCRKSSAYFINGSQSPVYEFYSAIEFNREMDLLLRIPDRSYVFRAKFMGVEIGKWKVKKDSLFLYPKMNVNEGNDTCLIYNGYPYEYYIDDSLCVDPHIPYRLYISDGKNMIKDHTLEHFHFADSVAWYIIEPYPMKKRKIKATREEKNVLRCRRLYGCGFFGGD